MFKYNTVIPLWVLERNLNSFTNETTNKMSENPDRVIPKSDLTNISIKHCAMSLPTFAFFLAWFDLYCV